METQVKLLEGKWQAIDNLMVERFDQSGHPVFKKCFSIDSWNVEEKEQQGAHTFHCGSFEHRALKSNGSLSKSVQYLRSSCKLV